MLKYELKIRSCSLFVSPVANFSPWQKIIPLYNFSEFLCQLNNSENYSQSLGIKKTGRNAHYVLVNMFSSDHMYTTSEIVFGSSYSSHNNWPLY